MTFNHLDDLQKAFTKCAALLNPHGELHLVIPDFDYFKRPRHRYQMEIEDIDQDEYAVMIHRSEGNIADIVRKEKKYTSAAEKANLSFMDSMPMCPTAALIDSKPSYREFADTPITHLLRFRLES